MKKYFTIILGCISLIGVSLVFEKNWNKNQPPFKMDRPEIPSRSEIRNQTSLQTTHPANGKPITPRSNLQKNQSQYLKKDFQTRMTEIEALGENLSPEQWKEFQAFLPDQHVPPGYNQDQIHALKDEILTKLYELPTPPPELTDLLIHLYQDRSQDPVMRDYVIQHLSAWYINSGKKTQIEQVLRDSLQEIENSTSGTSLMALQRLSDSGQNSFKTEEVMQLAYAMAINPKTCEESRIAALQVCGELRVANAFETLLQTAQSGASIPIQMAAIGALGNMGNTQAIPLLETMIRNPDSRLQGASRSALHKLSKESRHS